MSEPRQAGDIVHGPRGVGFYVLQSVPPLQRDCSGCVFASMNGRDRNCPSKTEGGWAYEDLPCISEDGVQFVLQPYEVKKRRSVFK